MNLALLVPAFLIGLGILTVPVLIHLRQRERTEPIRFPSLMFLRQIPHKATERRRLTHPFLLFLRALACALLVLAFARPFLKRSDTRPLLGSPPRTVIVAVDRSMSMGYRGTWNRARDSALAAVRGLGRGDRLALVAFDETAEIAAGLSIDPATFNSQLARLVPTGHATRFAPAIRVANDIAVQARGSTVEIVFVTDLQRTGVAGLESVEQPRGATLRVVSVGPSDPVNARLADVQADQQIQGRQARLTVTARAVSQGAGARDAKATLVVAGRELATVPIRLKPNTVQSVRFDPVIIPATEATALVALAPDNLPADDTLRFALGAATGVEVVLALPAGASRTESLFLEKALAISRSPTLTVTVRRGGGLSDADLETVAAVVISDVGALSARSNASLERFIGRGGGVVLFAGRGPAPAPDQARWLPGAIGRVIDRSSDRGARLGQLDSDHPVFEPFKDAIASDFGVARFYRYRDIRPDSGSAVLGRFDDGRPALVERAGPAGRVVLIAGSANVDWSDLPLQPVFLPLVQRLVAHVAGLVDAKRWFAVGDVGALPRTLERLTLQSPGGGERRIEPDSSRTVELSQAGTYLARSDRAAEPVARFAVNTPIAESDLTAVGAKEIGALLKATSDSIGQAAELPPVAAQERSQSWWLYLLVLAMIVLVIEALYSRRLLGSSRVAGEAR